MPPESNAGRSFKQTEPAPVAFRSRTTSPRLGRIKQPDGATGQHDDARDAIFGCGYAAHAGHLSGRNVGTRLGSSGRGLD
jgi:hypothetical protein